MRILVLGGNGMAGHLIKIYFQQLSYEVYYSIREQCNDPAAIQLDLTVEKSTYTCLQNIKPDIVINAAGVLNQDAANRIKEAIYINSLLPHKLADYGNELGFKLFHISTDCVFSGLKGNYTEEDLKDGNTIYAITKNLGEVISDKHVTIRTSIIGPEIRKNGIGLFHWFMNQLGTIQGYQQAFWNGVTTLELVKTIDWVIQNKTSGLVHLTGTKSISKYDLLLLLQKVFNRDIEIIPFNNECSDKTLVNTRQDFTYPVQEYESMIQEMKKWMENNAELYNGYIFK